MDEKEEALIELQYAAANMASLYQEAIRNKFSPIIYNIRADLLEARLRYSEARKTLGLRYFDHEEGYYVET